ncbi:MAG: ABC transporter permease [Bacteroidota bacterium]|nr:ABC transporter permease [Bacteroidota bacterium]
MNKVYIIDADAGLQLGSRLNECWHRRDLIQMLIWRDIKVKYIQTYLGLSWAILNPVISILLLLFVFHIVTKVELSSIPPILFILSGLCIWNYFSKVVAESGESIIGAQSLVKKIYFPRLVIPISKILGGLIEFAFVFIVLLVLLFFYGYDINLRYLFLIPAILLTIMISLGCGIWVAALSIRFRDFHYITPVMLRIGMFVSPVAYGSQFVENQYKWIVSLNPLTGIIDLMRWIFFDLPLDPDIFTISVIFGLLILLSGIWYFIRMEKYIADII